MNNQHARRPAPATAAWFSIGTVFTGLLLFSLTLLALLAANTSESPLMERIQSSVLDIGLTYGFNVTDTSRLSVSVTPVTTGKKKRVRTGLCVNETVARLYSGESWLKPRGSLTNSLIPQVVHYVWCSNSSGPYFDFRHFLSVKSAIAYVSAEAVYLYHDVFPPVDEMWYNTWLLELRTIYPYLMLVKTDPGLLCRGNDDYGLNFNINWEFLAAELNKTGGVYVREYVVLGKEIPGMGEGRLGVATTPDGGPGVVSGKPGSDFLKAVAALSKPASQRPPDVAYSACVDMNEYKESEGFCAVVGDKHAPFFPKDLWGDDSTFSQVGRRLLYGTPEMPRPVQHDHDVIPRIAHYTYFGGGKMDFLFYLSVLSCLHVLKLDAVYIHGDKPPSGVFWPVLQEKYPKQVVWLKRARPKVVFGKPLLTVAHEADIAGTDIMVKHGGIHSDPDALFIRELPEDYWRHDAILPVSPLLRDHFSPTTGWGVFLGAPNSELWRMVKLSHRCFVPTEWHWNCERLMTKMHERNPHVALVESKLQVLCKGTGSCWTNVVPGEPELSTSNVTGWMNKVHCVHYVHGARAFADIEHAKSDVTMNGAAARLVLRAAGLL